MKASRYFLARDRLPNSLIVCALVQLISCGLGLSAHAQTVDLRLRVTWGQQQARRWDAVFELNAGRFGKLRQLGYDANAPNLTRHQGARVLLWQHVPMSFDGVDLQVTAPRDASLTIRLTPDSKRDEAKQIVLPLARFIEDQRFSQSIALDAQGNKLVVRRAPGDHLRVVIKRSSLVFAPGESFGFELAPHELNLEPGSAVQGAAEMRAAGSSDVLWQDQRNLAVGPEGDVARWPITVQVPLEEGVYDIEVGVFPADNPLRGDTEPIVQRKVQLVVLGNESQPAADANWSAVTWETSRDPNWFQRMTDRVTESVAERVPLPSPFRRDSRPNATAPPRRTNGRSRPIQHLSRQVTELAVDGWEAVPLPVARLGVPHVVEVEYPNDRPQTLGISVLDVNAVGAMYPLQLDSGVDVTADPPPDQPAMQRHRLLFWPRSRKVHLLLANRRSDRPGLFGNITVQAGPASLPIAPQPRVEGGRLVSAYFDMPLFPENFSAPEALDALPQRSLRDWRTFYEGGRRMVQYLKHVGYNTATLSVARYGGTLYPTDKLSVTTRFDNGALFVSGQDPLKKDVLEMLFRMFDREGLKLIPAVHFATPLPELDARLQRREGAEGIELVGDDGQWWLRTNLPKRGSAPYYNALDPRVQEAMRGVLDELATRYSHHPSFAGITLQLGENTYAQLPGEPWGQDETSLATFSKATQAQLPPPEAREQRAKLLADKYRGAWLNWRADVLTEFYRRTQADLVQHRPDARLFLAMADTLTSQPVKREFQPHPLAKPDFANALLEQGIDAQRIAAIDNVVLLGPRRQQPITALTTQATDVSVHTSSVVEEYFTKQGRDSDRSGGALHYHQLMPARLPDFDQQSPFDRTYTWLGAHVSPSGVRNRARFVHSIATLDAAVLVDGGWMLPMGQEDAVRDLFATYRALPTGSFETVKPRALQNQTSGAVVRSLSVGGQTFLYIVNDSPWPATVDLLVSAPTGTVAQSLGPRPLPQLDPSAAWPVEMQPYDLAAIQLSKPGVRVLDWRVRYTRNVAAELGPVVEDIKGRVNELRHPAPVPILANPSFELADARGMPLNWEFSRDVGVSVRIDNREPHHGQQSLYLRVAGADKVGWVRSEPFAPPTTGRLSVGAWVRTSDPDQQPDFRLIIEAEERGKPYRRSAALGAGAVKLGKTWPVMPKRPTGEPVPPYVVHIDDVPWTDLTNVRVRFELAGTGEVWIDAVEVYDLYFQESELKELLKNLVAAGFGLRDGKLAETHQFLHGYWPQFVLEHVPPPRLVQAPIQPANAAPNRPTRPNQPPAPREPANPPREQPSGLQRFWSKFLRGN